MALSSRLSGSTLKAANVKSSGGNNNALMNMMMAQAMLPEKKAAETEAKMGEQQIAQSQLGPKAVQTKSVGGNITAINPDVARVTTAEAMNQNTRIKQIKNVIHGMENMAKTLPTDFPTVALQNVGAKYFFGRMGTSKTKVYNSGAPAAAAGVYRAVTGDNRLSDIDASIRAMPLIWNPMEPADVREGKFAFLNFMLDEAERGLDPNSVGEPKDSTESQLRWQAFVQSSKEKFEAIKNSNSNIEKATIPEDKIMMLSPTGQQVPVHPKQVQIALKRGLKMPQGS